MKKVLFLLFTAFTISCSQNNISDISDSDLNTITEEGRLLYSMILSEEHKKGGHWKNQIRDAKNLKKSIEKLMKRVDNNQLIDEHFINNLNYNKGLREFLPHNLNILPPNYKKLIIKNYEQRVIDDLKFECLITSRHYFYVKSSVQEEKDTIQVGDEYAAKISVLASNFRDTIFLYDENDNLVFRGIDSLGYVDFRRKETSKGLKIYKGYYKSSLLNNYKIPRIRIEYYVE